MTFEGLGEKFEGDSADMCAEKFPLVLMGGPIGGSHVHRTGSKDPHRRYQKFSFFLFSKVLTFLPERRQLGL